VPTTLSIADLTSEEMDEDNIRDFAEEVRSKSPDVDGEKGAKPRARTKQDEIFDLLLVKQWLTTHQSPSTLVIFCAEEKQSMVSNLMPPGIDNMTCMYCHNLGVNNDDAKEKQKPRIVFCRQCTLMNACESCVKVHHTKKSCEDTVKRLQDKLEFTTYKIATHRSPFLVDKAAKAAVESIIASKKKQDKSETEAAEQQKQNQQETETETSVTMEQKQRVEI